MGHHEPQGIEVAPREASHGSERLESNSEVEGFRVEFRHRLLVGGVAASEAKAGELVAQLLLKENVGLERVAIVGMRRLAKSCLAGKPELAGFPVEASRAQLRLHVFVKNGVEIPGRAYATL